MTTRFSIKWSGINYNINIFIRNKVYKKIEVGGVLTYTSADSEAKYFLLRIDKDPHSRKALQAYADSVVEDNKALASDIAAWLEETKEEFELSQI